MVANPTELAECSGPDATETAEVAEVAEVPEFVVEIVEGLEVAGVGEIIASSDPTASVSERGGGTGAVRPASPGSPDRPDERGGGIGTLVRARAGDIGDISISRALSEVLEVLV